MASGNFLSNDKNRVLLWTNPNPSSAFGTQTINFESTTLSDPYCVVPVKIYGIR